MKNLAQYLGKKVAVELSGKIVFRAILVDIGLDILVIYKDLQFHYIPFYHVQCVTDATKDDMYEEEDVDTPGEPAINHEDKISVRKMLTNVKGMFVEIYVTANQSVHGYVTNILSNYFAFYSPIYKTMFIPLNHLKWLTPYNRNQTPYSLNREHLPVNPSSIPLARTFEEQLKKLEGKMVVFDLGENSNKIGLMHKVEHNIVELITADERRLYWHLHHLKTVHIP